jgi:uncharacterized repeat protein (TIGR01451 family)
MNIRRIAITGAAALAFVAGVWRRGRLAARLAMVLSLGVAGLGALALATAPAAQAATATTFTETGGEQTYAVPPGVTAVAVTAVGAPGGNVGGEGAVVTATVPLPAGTTTLYVEVGQPGLSTGCPASVAIVGAFNGGGFSPCGGGGGGASDVRTTSIATVPDSALTAANDSRLVVAAGGGGGGNDSTGGVCAGTGGTAGDNTVSGPGNGGDGSDTCQAAPGGDGGFGGSVGGTGGAGTASSPCPGNSGSLGQGGDVATFCETQQFDGGGGGGYYGGGAGGNGLTGGGGGAGSSFWVTGATSTSMSEDTTGVPEVQITPASPDLSLTDTAPGTAVSGQPYSYTLMATNTGGFNAAGTVITDTLPASAHFGSASATQGSCTRTPGSPKPKGGTVSCTVGSLAAGASVTVTITVSPTKPGTVSDNASVTASNVTADSDDTASASTTTR